MTNCSLAGRANPKPRARAEHKAAGRSQLQRFKIRQWGRFGTRLRIKGHRNSCASVTADGTIRLDDGEEFAAPSSAAKRAKELAGESVVSVPGWDYWLLPDKRPLDDVRQEFLASHQSRNIFDGGDNEPPSALSEQAYKSEVESEAPLDAATEGGLHWFKFASSIVSAQAYYLRGALWVIEGSEVNMGVDACTMDAQWRRQQLLGSGGLTKRYGNVYRLEEDVEFQTASAAATFVAGGSNQGPELWIDDRGRTIRQVFPGFVQERDRKRGWH